MSYSTELQKVFPSECDSRLPHIVKQLTRVLANAQRQLTHKTLRLNSRRLEDLAGILIDFAVDIHNEIGIWTAYERYNIEFFGTPLPLTHDAPAAGLSRERIHHLLWMVYPLLIEGLVLSPCHQDLSKITDVAAAFLHETVLPLPKDSGVKQLMNLPNTFAWEVKRKLVWLGTRSYMFRNIFHEYLRNNNRGKFDIGHTDDFVCQETTCWSGLGPIDILAGVLSVPDDQRKELRSWYLRHASAYKLTKVGRDWVDAVNVINDRQYHICFSMDHNPFQPRMLIFGSVTPWRGKWYWSGAQRFLGDASEEIVEHFKKGMITKTSIICRFWKEQEQLVRERFAAEVKRLLEFHGNDLVAYPDGLTMAAEMERELKVTWDSKSPEEIKTAMEKHGLKKPRPSMSLPKELIEQKDGLGVFINPDEGKEILLQYNTVVSGLKKNGGILTEEETEAIWGCINADAVSPAFVKRLLCEHGGETSIKKAFLLEECDQEYWLDYLLRNRKGHFFRKRFPAFSVI